MGDKGFLCVFLAVFQGPIKFPVARIIQPINPHGLSASVVKGHLRRKVGVQGSGSLLQNFPGCLARRSRSVAGFLGIPRPDGRCVFAGGPIHIFVPNLPALFHPNIGFHLAGDPVFTEEEHVDVSVILAVIRGDGGFVKSWPNKKRRQNANGQKEGAMVFL